MTEAFEDTFSWDSRALNSVFALLFKPGFLTREYFLGRRARYIPPLRLYIFSSLLFFFYLSLQNTFNTDASDNLFADVTIDESVQAVDPPPTRDDQQPINPVPQTTNSSHDIESAITDVNISWLTDLENERLRAYLNARTNKAKHALQENPGQLADAFLDIAPALMFLLLPLFALLLKLVYITSGRYYAEHLILAIHNHSALFLVILLSALLEWLEETTGFYLGSALILTWIPLYMFLSLSRVFAESFPVTLMKFSVLGLSYLILFTFAFVIGWIAGIMIL